VTLSFVLGPRHSLEPRLVTDSRYNLGTRGGVD
jgi:hypothetical protein